MILAIMWGHYDYIISDEFSSVQISFGITHLAHDNLGNFVFVFFCISGFFAFEYSFNKLNERKSSSIGPFILNKIKRLYPLMILSIAFYLILAIIFRLSYGHFWAGRDFSLSQTILSFLGIENIVDSFTGINGPIWFVSVLMLCLVIFCLISASKLSKPYKLCLFAFLIILGLISINYNWSFILLSGKVARAYIAFFSGALISYLFGRFKNLRRLRWAISLLALSGIYFVFSLLTGENHIGSAMIVIAFIFFPALIVIGECKYAKKIFNNSVTDKLAEVSYAMFLFHIPVYLLINLIFKDSLNYNSWLALLIISIVVIALSFLFNWLNKKFINTISKKPANTNL